jgi:hypothetical protein
VTYTVVLGANGSTAPSEYVTINTTSKIVSIVTNLTTLNGNVLTGDVALNVKVTRSYSGSVHKTQDHNFTLTFTNPCESADLNTVNAVTISNMSVALGASVTSSSYNKITDSVNSANSNLSCGDRTYTVKESSTNFSYATTAVNSSTGAFTITVNLTTTGPSVG